MLRSIAAECECSCSHSRSALRCVSKHEGAHIGSSSSFETRARPFVLCGFSSACALLRMRTASRSVQLTMSNSPSRSRGAFSAPGVLHRCFAHPERGWAERRETFGCSAEHPWGVSCASKTRVNALMTRYARRLRGALRPMTQQSTWQNNVTISMMAGRSVPIVSQTEIYSDEMALPPARSHTTAVTEPPPVPEPPGPGGLGWGRNSSAVSQPPRALA